jgi:hypothetical protein
MSDLIACPDPNCDAPARITDRWRLGSTSGPVEQIKTMCERGHWFTPLVSTPEQPAEAARELVAQAGL